jgi:threonine/homoserine/homoserine lactone efflux protein
MITTVLPFLGACLLIAATPGPSTMLIIRRSLHSKRDGLLTVLGNETGVFTWGLVAAFGLTALLSASTVAFDVMRAVGACVLIGFGVQALRAARRGDAANLPERAEVSGWQAYRSGLLINLANPKVGVFAVSFLPQFVPAGAPRLPTMVGLAALWAGYEIGHYALYVWFVGRLQPVIARAGVRRRLEQLSGGVLILLGVRLAVEG